MDVKNLHNKLAQHGQEHLLEFWPQLTEERQNQLYNDLMNIDFSRVAEIFKQCMQHNNEEDEKLDKLLQPIPSDVFGSVSRAGKNELKSYRDRGLEEISNGRVGVLLLAGGQGTRLGVTYPKGMYDVGLLSKKPLYQLQCERILRLQALAKAHTGKDATIPWYIMTSEQTMEPTLEFFTNHKYFGMKKENLIVFEQNMLPCLTFNGKVILESPYKVARAPDGNGGLYSALEGRGIIRDMEQRGIQFLHVYCVDNILVKLADPVFIGYCISKNANCAAKVVEKAFPTEAVGVVCKVSGKYQVVEYSEVSLNTAQRRNPDGRLTFSAGNICNHFFTLEFLKMIAKNKSLKHHIAKKKIPYVGENGVIIKPEKVNGIKLEKFVFDVFEFSDQFAVWEVLREDEFSPLKNADGAEKDTPTTARHSLYNLHQRYILQAGGTFIDEDGCALPLIPSSENENGYHNGTNGHDKSCESQKSCLKYECPVICEISPLISYAGEGLEHLVSGKKFASPFLLESPDFKTLNGDH